MILFKSALYGAYIETCHGWNKSSHHGWNKPSHLSVWTWNMLIQHHTFLKSLLSTKCKTLIHFWNKTKTEEGIYSRFTMNLQQQIQEQRDTVRESSPHDLGLAIGMKFVLACSLTWVLKQLEKISCLIVYTSQKKKHIKS